MNIEDDDPALAVTIEQYRQRSAARVAEIKGAILDWLKPRASKNDTDDLTRALLEVALDRHVAAFHADGFDVIEAAYRRAVERWRGTQQ